MDQNTCTHFQIFQNKKINYVDYLDLKPQKTPSQSQLLVLETDLDIVSPMEALKKFSRETPPVGFVDQVQISYQGRVPYYLGLGLTYNPHFIEELEPHIQVMGSTRPNIGTVFSGEAGKRFHRYLVSNNLDKAFFFQMRQGALKALKFFETNKTFSGPEWEEIKKNFNWKNESLNKAYPTLNTYADPWGFTQLTKAGQIEEIADLFHKIGLQPIRSRYSILSSKKMAPKDFAKGWHTDEHYIFELRVYIPLVTSKNYFIEIADFGKFSPEVGKIYIWNTKTPHRAGAITSVSRDRHSLILGFSPWFTLRENKWEMNSNFGIHPFDLLLDEKRLESLKVENFQTY